MMRKKLEEYQAGDREPLLEAVRPDHPGEHLDADAREEEFEAEVEKYGCEVD